MRWIFSQLLFIIVAHLLLLHNHKTPLLTASVNLATELFIGKNAKLESTFYMDVDSKSFRVCLLQEAQNEHDNANSYHLVCFCVIHAQMSCTRYHDVTSSTHFLVDILQKHLQEEKHI